MSDSTAEFPPVDGPETPVSDEPYVVPSAWSPTPPPPTASGTGSGTGSIAGSVSVTGEPGPARPVAPSVPVAPAAPAPPPIPPVPNAAPAPSASDGSASDGSGPPTPSVSSTPSIRRPVVRTIVGLLVVLGLFGLGFGARSLLDEDTTVIERQSNAAAVIVPSSADGELEPVAAVAAVVGPSVVQIETQGGLGSGVFYDDSGLIMTNAHVVGDAESVTVRSADGASVTGQVLGTDPGTDVAVVRVSGLDVPAAVLSTSKPDVGQLAVAVGSPFGLDQTVTSGIVSAVNRPVDGNSGIVVNMVQTDASINPGNSGGALADRRGQIIGINTAIFSQSGENNGIGFAIPIRTAKATADKLAAGETITRAGLGISGPSGTADSSAGATVQGVTEGSAAATAGIRAGDRIVAVDGSPIRSFEELRGTISSYSPGDEVTVTVVRGDQRLDLPVTLGTLGR